MGVKIGTGRALKERKPNARVPRIGGCFPATRYGADACIITELEAQCQRDLVPESSLVRRVYCSSYRDTTQGPGEEVKRQKRGRGRDDPAAATTRKADRGDE
jgi:hypothetical protein